MRTLATVFSAALVAVLAAPAAGVTIEAETFGVGQDGNVNGDDSQFVDFDYLQVDPPRITVGYGGGDTVVRTHVQLLFDLTGRSTAPDWEFRANALDAIINGDATDLFDRPIDLYAETNLDRAAVSPPFTFDDFAMRARNTDEDPGNDIAQIGSSTVSATGDLVVPLGETVNNAINAGASTLAVTMVPAWRAFPVGDVDTRTGQIGYQFGEPSPFALDLVPTSNGPQNISIGVGEMPTIESVPEPATALMVGLAGAAVLTRRRHVRRHR